MILLVAMYVERSARTSASFPSLLLIVTLFRLALNVARRLVLLHGDAGAGDRGVRHTCRRRQLVVGLVIFLILLVIQFVVITNGAGASPR